MTLYFLNRFCAPCIIRHVLAAVQMAEAKRRLDASQAEAD